jgi:hypothetical protein
MDIGGFSPGKKWPGCEADRSPPSIAEVKKGAAIPPVPHASLWSTGITLHLPLLWKVFVSQGFRLSKECCHLRLSLIVLMRHEWATTKTLNHGRVILYLLLYLFLFILNSVVDSLSQIFCYFPIYLTSGSLLQNSYFCVGDICKPYILTSFYWSKEFWLKIQEKGDQLYLPTHQLHINVLTPQIRVWTYGRHN